jgi:hypothetical protein
VAIDHETAWNFETVTVATTAIGVVASSGDNVAHRAVITVETAQIRFRYDGTAPTATVGHLAEIGDRLTIEGRANIRNFLAIRTGATSGTLQVTVETI